MFAVQDGEHVRSGLLVKQLRCFIAVLASTFSEGEGGAKTGAERLIRSRVIGRRLTCPYWYRNLYLDASFILMGKKGFASTSSFTGDLANPVLAPLLAKLGGTVVLFRQ